MLTQIFQRKNCEKELSELPDNSSNVFKKPIDCYMGRLSATFCSGKYSVLNDFCYAEFLAYYTLESESDKTYEYQPNKLDDSQIENNHEDCLYLTEKKMILRETIQYHKVRQILQYHVPNKLLFPEKCSHHLLHIFYRGEKEYIKFSIIVSKQTARARSPVCVKLKQNKV